jgi:hypothetical protein
MTSVVKQIQSQLSELDLNSAEIMDENKLCELLRKRPRTARQLARALDIKNRKRLNAYLYDLLKTNTVCRGPGAPPVWRIPSPEMSQLIIVNFDNISHANVLLRNILPYASKQTRVICISSSHAKITRAVPRIINPWVIISCHSTPLINMICKIFDYSKRISSALDIFVFSQESDIQTVEVFLPHNHKLHCLKNWDDLKLYLE